MRNLEKRLTQLEERHKIATRQPAPTLIQLYTLIEQRRAAGQPLFANQCQERVHHDPAIY